MKSDEIQLKGEENGCEWREQFKGRRGYRERIGVVF